MPLEEYHDEERWKRFSASYGMNLLSEADRERLRELGFTAPEQLETLAVAVTYFDLDFDYVRRWLDAKIEVLDRKTPRECLEDAKLIKRLRVALTRMPC